MAEIFASSSSSVGASAAAGISSQCPVQTEASSSHAAEIVKITGFDILATPRDASLTVVPAKAGTHARGPLVGRCSWVPAFAGTTGERLGPSNLFTGS